MDDLHIKRQHHLTARISVFIVRTQFKYSMLTEIKDLETLELFDSIVFDANYLKAGGKVKSIIGMPYKPYSYLMEQYVICFRKLTIFSVGNKTVMDKLSVGVMTQLDKMYNQCYKTPVALVNGILDKLPVDIWNNPNKTFIDPFCGTGEFIVQVQKRLMAGLVEIPLEERLDFINKNMLYYNDINNNWVEWTRFRLGGGNGFNEDFSKWEPEMKFDVIIGNPPYQTGNQGLWQLFANKNIGLVKDDGILSLVTPNSWANGSHLNTNKNIFNSIFQRYQTLVINTNVNESFVGIGKNISYWIVKKTMFDENKETLVINDNKETVMDITELPFFINVFSFTGLEIFKKVLSKKTFWKEFIERKPKGNREFAFPKIRFNAGYKYGYKYDGLNHNFPTSPVVLAIDCSEYSLQEVENIHNQFNSKLFKFLWNIYGANDAGSFGWILRSMPRLDHTKFWTDEEIYQHFGLTEEEILYIEQTVK